MIQHMHCLLVSRKMFCLIHFDFSLLACIFVYSLFDEITVHGYVKITFNYDSAHAKPLGVSQDELYDSLELLSACTYILFTHFVMKLQYMATLKSLLTAFYPMKLHLVFV